MRPYDEQFSQLNPMQIALFIVAINVAEDYNFIIEVGLWLSTQEWSIN